MSESVPEAKYPELTSKDEFQQRHRARNVPVKHKRDEVNIQNHNMRNWEYAKCAES
jgi:hypothetical protein